MLTAEPIERQVAVVSTAGQVTEVRPCPPQMPQEAMAIMPQTVQTARPLSPAPAGPPTLAFLGRPQRSGSDDLNAEADAASISTAPSSSPPTNVGPAVHLLDAQSPTSVDEETPQNLRAMRLAGVIRDGEATPTPTYSYRQPLFFPGNDPWP